MTDDVRSITVDREAMALLLTFDDDHECRLDLVEVRLRCPCAQCRGLRDRGEQPWPRPGSPTPLGVEGAELVGAWGLGITWNDGHATGIYPFESLRRWCETGEPAFTPDSGLGA